jgi:hypothetical protein
MESIQTVTVLIEGGVPECGSALTESFTFLGDMTCGATAIEIAASNVTIDCQGHTITYATATFGNAISLSPPNFQDLGNLTVRNCRIVQGRPESPEPGAVAVAVSFNAIRGGNVFEDNEIITYAPGATGIFAAQGSTVRRTTVTTRGAPGAPGAWGIVVGGSSGGLIEGNVVETTGSDLTAIELRGKNVIARNNIVRMSGVEKCLGIAGRANQDFLTVAHNTVEMRCNKNSDGIKLFRSESDAVVYNTVLMQSATSQLIESLLPSGIHLEDTSATLVASNTITQLAGSYDGRKGLPGSGPKLAGSLKNS